MELVFAPEGDPVLARVVEAAAPRGFVHGRIEGAMGSSFAEERAVSGYDAYAEASRAADVFAHLPGGARDPLWVYRVVTAGDSRVRFEDGYMGGPAATVVEESRWAVVLVRHPDLTLVSWVVRSGGQGYETTTIAEGRDGRTLLAHLERSSGRPPAG